MAPIRPHHKSRSGCKTCKKRKVKCDETEPTCQNCIRRGMECVWINPPTASTSKTQTSNQPTSPPSSNSQPPSPSGSSHLPQISFQRQCFDLLSLHLLHHYTTSAHLCIAESETHKHGPTLKEVYGNLIPRLATSVSFPSSSSTGNTGGCLMHAILSFSALHLHYATLAASATKSNSTLSFDIPQQAGPSGVDWLSVSGYHLDHAEREVDKLLQMSRAKRSPLLLQSGQPSSIWQAHSSVHATQTQPQQSDQEQSLSTTFLTELFIFYNKFLRIPSSPTISQATNLLSYCQPYRTFVQTYFSHETLPSLMQTPISALLRAEFGHFGGTELRLENPELNGIPFPRSLLSIHLPFSPSYLSSTTSPTSPPSFSEEWIDQWNNELRDTNVAETYRLAVLVFRYTFFVCFTQSLRVRGLMFWPATVPPRFIELLVKERRARALVIFGWYCALHERTRQSSGGLLGNGLGFDIGAGAGFGVETQQSIWMYIAQAGKAASNSGSGNNASGETHESGLGLVEGTRKMLEDEGHEEWAEWMDESLRGFGHGFAKTRRDGAADGLGAAEHEFDGHSGHGHVYANDMNGRGYVNYSTL